MLIPMEFPRTMETAPPNQWSISWKKMMVSFLENGTKTAPEPPFSLYLRELYFSSSRLDKTVFHI